MVDKIETETEVVESTADQHGSAIPEGFGDAVDKAIKVDDVTEEQVSEETEEVAEETEEVSEETTDTADEEVTEAEKPTEVEQETSEEVSQVVERPQKDVVTEEIKEIKFDLDPELVDPQVKAAIDSMAATLTEQQKAIAEERESLRVEREKAFENRVDKCFDRYSGDLDSIGNSTSLTEQNGKYRRELFQHAHVTAQIHGISIEDAIEKTVTMFKNMDGEQVTEKRLITKLNKQKSDFTNPPTRKKSSPMTRKFKTETEKVNYVMDEAYKAAGIE